MGYRSTLVTRGPFLTHPGQLPRSQHNAATLWRIVQTAGPTYNAYETTDTTFYTAATYSADRTNAGSVYNVTAMSTDTYKTVTTITGAGILYGVMGPHMSAANIMTARITIDGKEFTVTLQDNQSGRCYLGYTVPKEFAGGGVSTAGRAWSVGAADAASPDGKTTQYRSQPRSMLDVPIMQMMGTPGVLFNTSLLVEVKTSAGTYTDSATLALLLRSD